MQRKVMHDTFVTAKLKVFKVLRTDSASMKWPFLGGFRALAPPNMVQYCPISRQRKYSSKQKHYLEKLERFGFL